MEIEEIKKLLEGLKEWRNQFAKGWDINTEQGKIVFSKDIDTVAYAKTSEEALKDVFSDLMRYAIDHIKSILLKLKLNGIDNFYYRVKVLNYEISEQPDEDEDYRAYASARLEIYTYL